MHLPSFQAATAQKPPVLLLQPRSPPRGSGPQPSGRVAMATTGFFFFFFFLHPPPHSHTSCAQSTRTCILTTLPLGLGQRRLISIQLAACSPPPLRLQAPAYPVAPAPLGPHRPAAPTSSPGTTAGAPQLALPWSFPGGPEHSRGSAQLLIAFPQAGGRRELHVRSGEGAP